MSISNIGKNRAELNINASEKKQISFGQGQLNVVATSDNHGQLNTVGKLDATIAEQKDTFFLHVNDKGAVNIGREIMIVKRGQQLMLPIKCKKLLKSNISKINEDKDRFSLMSFSGNHKTSLPLQVKSGVLLMVATLLAGVKIQSSFPKTNNPIKQTDLVENVENDSINIINLNLQPRIPQQSTEKKTIFYESNELENKDKSVEIVKKSPISEKNEQRSMNKIDINKPITTFGDSTAYGLGYYFENNLGVSSAGFLRPIKFKSLSNIKAGDQIIISLGYNDPDAAKEPEKYTAKVVDLVKEMQNKGAKVAIIGIKAQRNTSYNNRIAILNDALKEAAVQTNIQFVDISKFGLEQPDGVHFKDNKIFASKIRKALL